MIDNFYYFKNNGRYVEAAIYESDAQTISPNTTVELDQSIEDFNTLQFILRSSFENDGKRDTAAFTIAVSEAIENYNNPDKPFTFYSKDLSNYEMFIHGYFVDSTHFVVTTTQGCALNKVLGMTTSHIDDNPDLETDTVYLDSEGIEDLGDALENAYMFIPVYRKNGRLICYDFPMTYQASYKSYFDDTESGYDDRNTDMARRNLLISFGNFKNEATRVETSDSRYPIYVYNGFYYCEKPLGFTDEENMRDIIEAITDAVCVQGDETHIGYYADSDYGAVSFRNWDTSNITDLTEAFSDESSNIDYITWLDVTNWDTSNVTSLEGTFKGLNSLGDIFGLETWNVSNVRNMSYTFADCGFNFLGDAPDNRIYDYWNASEYGIDYLSQIDLSTWNPQNLENASYMFYKSNVGIPMLFNTPNLINMEGAFEEVRSCYFSDDSTSYLYDKAQNTYPNPLFRWNTANVFNMSKLFKDNGMIFYLEEMDTSAVTDMSYMFDGISNDEFVEINVYNLAKIKSGIEHMDVSKVIDMSYMFRNSFIGNNLNLLTWNTMRVENMSHMFYWDRNEVSPGYTPAIDEPEFSTNISGLNTSRVKNFSYMFYTWHDESEDYNESVPSTRRLAGGDVSRWDTSNATNMSYMFYNGKATGYSGFVTDFVTNMSHMFYKAEIRGNLAAVPAQRENLSSWNTNNVTNFSSMFEKSYFIPGVEAFRLNSPTDDKINKMFFLCKYGNSEYELNYVYDFSNWDTSNLTTLANMFHFYNVDFFENDTEPNTRPNLNYDGKMIGFDNWDTSNVTSMESMFEFCPINLGELDLSGWDFSNVTTINEMFTYAVAEKIILPPKIFYIDVEYETDESVIVDYKAWSYGYYVYPFDRCGAYTIEINNVDMDDTTGSTASIGKIFQLLFGRNYTISLGEQTVDRTLFTEFIARNWDLQSSDLRNLFDGTAIYKVDLTGWDVSGVTHFENMFTNASTLTNKTGCYDSVGFVGGVLDYSSLDNWTLPSGLTYEEYMGMCQGNLQSIEAYALKEGYHYGEQDYIFPNWSDGFWVTNGTGRTYYHSFENTAPNEDEYNCNTFTNLDRFMANAGYYPRFGTFVPNILDHIEAVFDNQAVIYHTTPLNDLKEFTTVTGYYGNDIYRPLNDSEYTLSGDLSTGYYTNVTASAEDMNSDVFTDTFEVQLHSTLMSISAAFDQSTDIVYTDAQLDSLKQYLVVTGTDDRGHTDTVPNSQVTLSGTLAPGTSIITASVTNEAGTVLTDTFNVTVTKTPVSLTAQFNQGSAQVTPSTPLDDLKQYLTVTVIYDNMTAEVLASSAYTLSGTLTAGTSVVTVSYTAPQRTAPVTTTFNVTVT